MTESSDEEIIEGVLVDDEDDPQAKDATGFRGEVRQGSPFAHDPPEAWRRARADAERRRPFEAGLWTATTGGAVLASAMLVPFGLASFWLFPGGAVAVAILGGAMSLMGLSSLFPRRSMVLLMVHITIFFMAEVRMWAG